MVLPPTSPSIRYSLEFAKTRVAVVILKQSQDTAIFTNLRFNPLVSLQILATAWLASALEVGPPPELNITATSSILKARAEPAQCRLPATDAWLSAGFGLEYLNCAPSTGTMKGFILFVDFSDQPASPAERPQDIYDFYAPGAIQWYKTASYGKLNLQMNTDTSRFYRMPRTAASYNFVRGESYDLGGYLVDAAEAYKTATGRSIDADVFYVAVARSATAIELSPAWVGNTLYDRSGAVISKKGVALGVDGYNSFGYKVVNHETGHAMCLPDLYRELRPTQELTGGFDMMAWINGQSPDYFGWFKWKLNWVTNSQVACVTGRGTTTHTLYPIERTGPNELKIAVVKLSETKAIVAEVRTNLGVNTGSCGSGVLLYTVETNIASAQGPIKVLDTNPGTVGCEGEPLNDAVMTLGKTYNVPDYNIRFTVTQQNGVAYTIQVNY